MKNRRCETMENCSIGTSKRFSFMDLPVVDILHSPQRQWGSLIRDANKNKRYAKHQMSVDWREYNPRDYIFSHASIVASVATEDNGYRIVSPCDEIVNANGNAWTNGVLSNCFKTFIGAENFYEHCFCSGQRVLMSDGTYKEIEKIIPGEFVINRFGERDKVLNVQVRKSKNIVKLKSNNIMSREILVTGNHPFFVFSDREDCPKTGKKNKPQNKKQRPKYNRTGFSCRTSKKNGENFISSWKSNWKNANELNDKRDVLTQPYPKKVVKNSEINRNRAKLIGWFLAEGSYMTTNNSRVSSDGKKMESGIVFCMSSNEKDIGLEIKKILIEEFGKYFRKDCEPRFIEHSYKGKSSYFQLYLSNRKVAEFFLKWCGKYSYAKKLHEDFLYLPLDLQAITLKSYISGDGCDKTKSRGYTVGSSSRDLIQQIKFISWRLGLNPLYKENGVLKRYSVLTYDDDGYEVFIDPNNGKKRRPEYILRFHTSDSIKLDKMNGIVNKNIISNSIKKENSIFSDNDGSWYVSWFEKEEVNLRKEVDVYNIEVENDNSYVVEGVVCHNCQIKAMSKGKILDAVLRPVTYVGKNGKKADILYCDILVATHRSHESIVSRVVDGTLSTLSMGCIAELCQCSYCGKITDDDIPNCEHLDNKLKQYIVDPTNNNKYIVAELCGAMDENGNYIKDSCQFIEASWVEQPAFVGAVVNYMVECPNVDLSVQEAIDDRDLSKLFSTDDILSQLKVADIRHMMAIRLALREIRKDKYIGIVENLTSI